MDANETLAADLLKRCGLRPERFTKAERRNGKTPDFRVFQGADLALFCEVKSIDLDKWLDRQLAEASPMRIAGGPRPDPTFNRLTDDIHEAVRQFDAVNPELRHPNVLIMVSHQSQCDFNDLLAVMTGDFFADSGERFPIYKRYADGRILSEKMRISLYVWLTPGTRERLLVTQAHEANYRRVCDLFGIDPANMRNLGA